MGHSISLGSNFGVPVTGSDRYNILQFRTHSVMPSPRVIYVKQSTYQTSKKNSVKSIFMILDGILHRSCVTGTPTNVTLLDPKLWNGPCVRSTDVFIEK